MKSMALVSSRASVAFLESLQECLLQGWEDGSEGKGTCANLDDISSIPGTYMAEDENQRPEVVPLISTATL